MCKRQGRRKTAAGSWVNIPGPKYCLKEDDSGKVGVRPGKKSDQQAERLSEEEDPLQVGQEGGIPCRFRKKRGSLLRTREEQGLSQRGETWDTVRARSRAHPG